MWLWGVGDFITEWPSCCNQPFIPVKLGAPLKFGFAFEPGINSKPVFLFGLKLGRAFRRLLSRRVMASYATSAVAFLLGESELPDMFSPFCGRSGVSGFSY